VRRPAQVAIVIGAVLASVGAWTLRPRPEVQVETAQVTAGPIARRVVATGTVTAVRTVDVGTQVSGIVQSLEVDFNSIVRGGQVIARLDPSLYQAALDQARAAQRQAEAASDQAQADLATFRTAQEDARIKLARAEALAKSKLIADADLDAARIAVSEASADVMSGTARLTQTRAAIAQAKAAVDQAAVDLDHTIIHSPIDGIVVARNVDVGQTLAAAVQAPVLFTVASHFRHMQVQVGIDESDVDGVKQGEPASFQVASYPDVTFQGTVTQLREQPVAEQTAAATTVATSTSATTTSAVATVVSYTALIDVANPDELLRPGMTAEVALGGSRRERVVRIPNRALTFRPPPEVLKALDEAEPATPLAADRADTGNGRSSDLWEYDGKRFIPVVVHLGLADDNWTELLSGSIQPGDAVVTSAVVGRRSPM
jgi:HlyD family secretion protein